MQLAIEWALQNSWLEKEDEEAKYRIPKSLSDVRILPYNQERRNPNLPALYIIHEIDKIKKIATVLQIFEFW